MELDVLVVPRSSRDKVAGVHDGRIKIQITAPPVDGAANAKLAEVLGRWLGVSKREVTLVRGATGRRKTLRIAGVDVAGAARRLGLGALPIAVALASLGSTACSSSSPLPVEVILPEDDTPFERTDNASLTLLPNGFAETFAVDGLDFELQVELIPDAEPRALSLFLADGEDLLGWGSTVPFITNGGDIGLSLFVGRPGALSTFPGSQDTPEPDVLATYAPGRGAVMLLPDGETYFLDEISHDISAAASLEDPPAADDGGLVGDALGGAIRVTWNDGWTAWRFDPGLDAWGDLSVEGGGLAPRPGGAHLVDAGGEALVVFGGGDALDAVRVGLLPAGEGALAAQVVPGLTLDDPRRGATAAWVSRTETDEDETVILFGTESTAPVLFSTAGSVPFGPAGPWTGGRCVQLDVGDQAGPEASIRLLCAGGTRAGQPTAQALVFTLEPGTTDAPEPVETLDLLPTPLPDPIWFTDAGAVYAQGEGQLFAIERATVAVEPVQTAAQRAQGGQSVTLATGSTFLVGGVDIQGAAVDRFQVFVPAL